MCFFSCFFFKVSNIVKVWNQSHVHSAQCYIGALPADFKLDFMHISQTYYAVSENAVHVFPKSAIFVSFVMGSSGSSVMQSCLCLRFYYISNCLSGYLSIYLSVSLSVCTFNHYNGYVYFEFADLEFRVSISLCYGTV